MLTEGERGGGSQSTFRPLGVVEKIETSLDLIWEIKTTPKFII